MYYRHHAGEDARFHVVRDVVVSGSSIDFGLQLILESLPKVTRQDLFVEIVLDVLDTT